MQGAGGVCGGGATAAACGAIVFHRHEAHVIRSGLQPRARCTHTLHLVPSSLCPVALRAHAFMSPKCMCVEAHSRLWSRTEREACVCGAWVQQVQPRPALVPPLVPAPQAARSPTWAAIDMDARRWVWRKQGQQQRLACGQLPPPCGPQGRQQHLPSCPAWLPC